MPAIKTDPKNVGPVFKEEKIEERHKLKAYSAFV